MRSLSILALLFTAATSSFGQSVTVSPAMPYVGVGAVVQFTATVAGLSSAAVTWSAGGVVGGNATAGTISPTTGYCGPLPCSPQNGLLTPRSDGRHLCLRLGLLPGAPALTRTRLSLARRTRLS